jgi:acetylornithine deacetylase
MQHFRAHGIPCVMLGTAGIERAHAVDEYVEIAELATVARTIIRVLCRFWQT